MMSFTKRIVANIKKDFYNLIRKRNVLNKIISTYILNLLRKLNKILYLMSHVSARRRLAIF
jgi:hypothetical protein